MTTDLLSDPAPVRRVAVLRSNPKDSALSRILIPLSKRYRVDCFLWDRQRDYEPYFRDKNIVYHKCRVKSGYYDICTILRLPLFQIWLFRKLISEDFDCIHAIDLDTGIVGWCVAKLKKKRFVYQCLDPYYANLPAAWPRVLGDLARRIENRVVSSADMFIITDLLRMPQHAGARPRRLLEFPNVPPATLPRSCKEPGEGLIVGYIGSLIDGRNLSTIIAAVGEMAGSGISMTIGGFGPLEEEVQRRAKEYKNITYIGWVPYADVLRRESTFDIFIHTTDPANESQRWVSPAKLFESMALGKAIIVTEDTLAAERVRLFGCGVTVRYGSTSDLQDAILKFKNDPSLMRKCGERGKAEFSRAWSWETVERRLLEAYRDLGPDTLRDVGERP